MMFKKLNSKLEAPEEWLPKFKTNLQKQMSRNKNVRYHK